jgi:MFS family permease
MLQEAGWGAVSAATTLGMVNLLRSLSGPCWGMALDRYRTSAVYAVSTVLSMLGLGMLVALPALAVATDQLIVAYTLAFGIGMAGSLPANAVLAARLFTPPQRAIAWGITDAAFAAGGAFGAWIVGWLFDISGDYVGALLLMGALLAGTYAIVRSLDRLIVAIDAVRARPNGGNSP